ncbi:flagellar export chaperone FliS [Agromyces humi]|uniref:flagellar export chaperone FliS n=1 Tax=Agromyces humi TaxID=1766800 RepID=UPI00135AB874|nr:flagellar export chaperone FliS [Agromyces humi]
MNPANRVNEYQRNAVLSASPTQLLTMLYDRLLLDLERARIAQEAADWAEASKQLIHAQDIVFELQSTLNVDAWSGGPALYALYDYVYRALVNANTSRDVKRTEEAISLLEPIRQSWHQALESMPAAHTGGHGA